MKSLSVRIAALAVCCLLYSSIVTAQPPAKIKVIKAGKLVDSVNGKVLTDQVIVIEGERIKAVGPNIETPAGAEVIDLSGMTVLPGLIDSHVHISGDPSLPQSRGQRSSADTAVIAHIYTERTLMAGFTSVRDLGSTEFLANALKRNINAGLIKGPRMLIATYYVGATGSPADFAGNPWSASLLPPEMTGVADGVDEIRKKVRYLVKNGAEVIKFGASAGVLSEEKNIGAPKYSQEEMNALVDEATRLGVKVAAHAHGTEAIKMAMKAGVASIEHGSLIDAEGIRMMKEKGVYLSADIYVTDYILTEYEKRGASPIILQKERQVGQAQRENFKKAVQAGVKIAFATDAGVYPHGLNGRQFAKMVEWGMTPMTAIQAATVNSADLFGWTADVGSVSVGKYADIIAVNGDPIANIAVLENIAFVMKGGTVYKNVGK